MRIGVFGGTFDPPHVGHLIVAQDAHTALRLDRVLFVPARVPPHKRHRELSPPDTRLALVLAAIGDDARFDASDLELRRDGPSYSVDTLRELREQMPRAELFFLMGVDQFREFESWRQPERIAELARVVVLSRGGVETPAPPLPVEYETLAVTRVDVSATAVRERVAAGRPVRYLVADAVLEIIEREGLYRAAVGAGRVRRCDRVSWRERG